MPKNDDNTDAFWNISSLVPKKTHISRPPESDRSPVTVSLQSGKPDAEEKIPPKNDCEDKPTTEKTVYLPEKGFIEKVELIPWKSFSFYSKFHADARKYFDIDGKECEYEYFFSYMPQYEQLSHRQMQYYFYFRSLVRRGEYPDADSSYVFLYIYETLNLDDILSPAERADILCNIWLAYRGKYRYLDKYIGQWLCDICLIYNISPPEKIRPILAQVLEKLSLPEIFYVDYPDEYISLARDSSAFDYKKSRYYADHSSVWDEHIPKAALCAINSAGDEIFRDLPPLHSVRDSFSGAIAYSDIKYKIVITYKSPAKSKAFLKTVELCEKAAENELRTVYDIKSRYRVSELPKKCADAINGYFDKIFPERKTRKKATDGNSEEYMKYYAPRRVGEADVARALRLERDAWETVKILDTEGVASEGSAAHAAEPAAGYAGGAQGARASAPADAARRDDISSPPDDTGNDFISSLDITLAAAISAAGENDFKGFCRRHNLMPLDIVRKINELSSEYIGDIIIDDDFSLIEDYKDDILSGLEKRKG